jgi:multicomponent Na+:H+ antiporter subunit G
MISEWVGLAFMALSIPFFAGGSLGLLRFPNLYTRLHALSKADNLGLGFVVIGMLVTADSWGEALKLVLIWLLVLAGSAIGGYLVANSELEKRNRNG